MTVARLLRSSSVIVCCGPGGVGKTTTSAALALGAAQLGRRACVVTIDPARRLADALGIGAITDLPHRIEGPWPGELDAVMLDARKTFDRLVGHYARDGEQAKEIYDNRLYVNLVSALSGTQEYMATEQLYELYDSGRYDLIVVDTPPSRDALAFLDAPRRLTSFLDNRLFRLLVAPGRASLRALSVASQLLLKTIARVAGEEIVQDTIAFFRAFDGMEQGFRDRAAAVEELLSSPSTAFVVVATPRRDAIDEANYLSGELVDSGHAVDLLVVNRVHPHFGHALRAQESGDGAWAELATNLAELARINVHEDGALESLSPVNGAAVVKMPMLSSDVHDVAGLQMLARQLHGELLP
jgi:anion-transporting  ArsA/GET3 family ATPase